MLTHRLTILHPNRDHVRIEVVYQVAKIVFNTFFGKIFSKIIERFSKVHVLAIQTVA